MSNHTRQAAQFSKRFSTPMFKSNRSSSYYINIRGVIFRFSDHPDYHQKAFISVSPTENKYTEAVKYAKKLFNKDIHEAILANKQAKENIKINGETKSLKEKIGGSQAVKQQLIEIIQKIQTIKTPNGGTIPFEATRMKKLKNRYRMLKALLKPNLHRKFALQN